jgi:hypothetical protein
MSESSIVSNFKWAISNAVYALLGLAILSAIPFLTVGNPFEEPPLSVLSYFDVQIIYLKLALIAIPFIAVMRPLLANRLGFASTTALVSSLLMAAIRPMLGLELTWPDVVLIGEVILPATFVGGWMWFQAQDPSRGR